MEATARSSVVRAVRLVDGSVPPREAPSSPGAIFYGRVTELTALPSSPCLTFIARVILDAQRAGETVVWVSARDSIFFPPDLAANGIDLDALCVVWAKNVRPAVRATEHLLRSNGFGLILVDLPSHAIIDQGRLGKLARLVDAHRAALLLITQHEQADMFTLGSLISLRLTVWKGKGVNGRYRYTVQATKDKRNAPGWKYTEVVHGPPGLH